MKLSDLFTPEEFAVHMAGNVNGKEEEIFNSALPYIDALIDNGTLTISEIISVGSVFASLDQLIREKTGEYKSVN